MNEWIAGCILTLAGVVPLLASGRPARAPRSPDTAPYVVVLGIAQDGGYPHPACKKQCCIDAWKDASLRRHVSSLAVVDPLTGERWLFDATPDFTAQLEMLDQLAPPGQAADQQAGLINTADPGAGQAAAAGKAADPAAGVVAAAGKTADPAAGQAAAAGKTAGLTGIFLTHAHIGHYTGLMYLGREAVGSSGVPVYALPRMRDFLTRNGPWSQLVSLGNIALKGLEDGVSLKLNARLSVTAFRIPHRDEFSETVGYRVSGPHRSFLFIPDIDKWERWSTKVEDQIDRVDYAFLDGTFFSAEEIPGRSMSEIPHPFISESLERFSALPEPVRSRVRFIHLNHSNPALRVGSRAWKSIREAGMSVAGEGERHEL